ncbi:MAG: FkbM family methyltransferase [Candidatus Eiseniibacteriota bacterium]
MMEWFGPLVQGPAKHVLRIARDPDYRAFCSLDAKLRGVPRHQECRARVDGWDLTIPDAASFLSSYREIFVERTLDFPQDRDAPRILDLGANIGLSVLAFKRQHPRARITALEPDPGLFQVLTRNVHGNGFTDVTLLQRAAWREDARLPFAPDGADGGRAVVDRSPGAEPGARWIDVEAISLPDLLRREAFDTIKMDIEGAERAVLPACAGLLGGVSRMFVEYHGAAHEASALGAVLAPLEDAGFHIQVQTVRSPRHPFLEDGASLGLDLILHIYAMRV